MERDRRRERSEDPEAAPERRPAPVSGILALQQSAGNAAVTQLLREPKAKGKEITGAKVNHDRVSVPPTGTPGVKVTPEPADAGGTLTYSVEGDGAAIDAGTTADAKGNITVGAK